MTGPPPSLELRRAIERLSSEDPARALVEVATREEDPLLWAAVVRRLLAEIRVEREGPGMTEAVEAQGGEAADVRT